MRILLTAVAKIMFFFVPFGIFLISILLIVRIVSRKFVYLRKLTPETVEETIGSQDSFWVEMFPELTAWFKKINLRAYGVNFLTEFEKLLRRLRLISSKIDTLTGRLIHQVRKSTKAQEEILSNEAKLEGEKTVEVDVDFSDFGNDGEDLKKKEQLLIIEIAKSPRDARLYRELGNVYMRTESWDDAKQSFEKALELEPEDEATKRKLGRVLSKLDQAAKIEK